MEFKELQAHIRTKTGNSPARVLRKDGKIPAILYGPNTEPILLSVNTKKLEQTIKESNSNQVFLNLAIGDEDKTTRPCMIKEFQKHPVSRTPLHVDFFEISMDRKIRVRVPIVLKGKSIGTEFGGILQLIRRELEVVCLPGDIPEKIELDVTNLDRGDSIHVKEIKIEGDIEIPAEVNFTIVTVVAPKGDKVEEEGEEAAAEETAEEAA